MCFTRNYRTEKKQFEAGVPSDWSSSRKDRIKAILSGGVAYVSSEESGDEDGVPVYYRKPLIWLKRKYQKSLHALDTLHHASLTVKSKQMFRVRCEGKPSRRMCPPNAPDFLLRKQLNSSISSNHDEHDDTTN